MISLIRPENSSLTRLSMNISDMNCEKGWTKWMLKHHRLALTLT